MLTKITLRGFKTIQSLDLTLGRINVLIGANGAGKSNFLLFFRLLNAMAKVPSELRHFVLDSGGGNSLLSDGREATSQVETLLSINAEGGAHQYYLGLSGAPHGLAIRDEGFRFVADGEQPVDRFPLVAWQGESALPGAAAKGDPTAHAILSLLRQCTVFQFHNTSRTSRLRMSWSVNDDHTLKEDGGNLAPFLHRLFMYRRSYYDRITAIIRQIAPFFADFFLEPEGDMVLLRWREIGTDRIFSAHEASDGTLRAMCLIALLLQPENDLPPILLFDEPELGLHPAAMAVVAGLVKSASLRSQVILATQSPFFVDQFDPDDVIVVDRPGQNADQPSRESNFRRLEPEKLKDWLGEYSLSELWEKNVLGGNPS